MTARQFLDWDAGDGRRWQLVDGVPVAMAPATTTHSRIEANLAVIIGAHLDAANGPCDLLVAPGVIPRADAPDNFRVPGLAVTCTPTGPETEAALREPVLIVKILSPSIEAETWSNVWTYTTIPAVQEILVVHSTRRAASLLRRLPDGSWPAERSELDRDAIRLQSIGLTVPLDRVYRRTRLAPVEASR